MPSPTTTDLPRPKSWDEFEDMVADVLKLRWRTPHVTRNGRNGQRQNGVDIYALARHLGPGKYGGAQCKRTDELTYAEILAEVQEAESFEPPLAEYIVATVMSRDAVIQKKVRLLNQDRVTGGGFPVEVLFWEDVCLDLAGQADLLSKHFSGWSGLRDREPLISVRWFAEEEETGELAVSVAPREFLDFADELEKFEDDEIEFLRESHPDDLALALEHNHHVDRAVEDADLRRQWCLHHAPSRFRHGEPCELVVSVENAPAEDILISFDIPEGLEVFASNREPPMSRCPALPRRPQLRSERESFAINMDRMFVSPTPSPLKLQTDYMMPNFATYIPEPTWRSRDVADDRFTLHLDSLSHGREFHFEGRQLGLVISATQVGRFEIHWRALAANRRDPCVGTLVVVAIEAGSDSSPDLDGDANDCG